MTVTIKWHYAVILEDAIEVETPSATELAAFESLDEWAVANFDVLYTAASRNKAERDTALPRLLWEDQHVTDVDSIDDTHHAELNP